MKLNDTSYAAIVRNNIARECGKENDLPFIQSLGYLFLAVNDTDEIIEVMINKYKSLNQDDIVSKLLKLKKK